MRDMNRNCNIPLLIIVACCCASCVSTHSVQTDTELNAVLHAPAHWFRYMGSTPEYHFLREYEVFTSFIPVPDRVWQRNIRVNRKLMQVVPETPFTRDKEAWTTKFEIKRNAEQCCSRISETARNR